MGGGRERERVHELNSTAFGVIPDRYNIYTGIYTVYILNIIEKRSNSLYFCGEERAFIY